MHELALLQGIVERGLIFFPVVLAMYIASYTIRFDDLSVEGSFGLGGSLTALLLTASCNGWLAAACALISGCAVGLVTGFLHTKLRLNTLISGLVVTTALFSVILKLSGPHLTFNDKTSLFTSLSWAHDYKYLVFLIPCCLLLLYAAHWFLQTQVGLLMRALGDNPQALTTIGKSVHLYQVLALSITNGLTALSGSLFVQYVGFFSIWSQVGILIIGLASLMLAQAIQKGFGIHLLFGGIIYQSLIATIFELNLDQDWNKFFTALLIVLLIVIKQALKAKDSHVRA